MGKTSSQVKDRYNAKAYDEIKLRVPKGKKAVIEAHAQSKGLSVNGLLNTLLQEDLNLSEEEWKRTTEEYPRGT